MGTAYWEHYSHPADMGIRGVGPTKAEAFAQAALAMTAVITDPQLIAPVETTEIVCEEPDDELLLFAWLGALLYEMDVRGMLFCRFDLEIDGQRLLAKASGERIDVEKHHPTVQVKAATYADLKVHQDAQGRWVAQCIVDV